MSRTQFAPLTHAASAGLAARIARRARARWQAYWEWRAREVTIHILRSLDGRTLHDIGINPSEIESYVHCKHRDRKRIYDANWPWRAG